MAQQSGLRKGDQGKICHKRRDGIKQIWNFLIK